MEPKVSIVIPCYNLGQYLDEAVKSVLNQTFQDFEVIIINDGSTDHGTNKLLCNYHKPKTSIYHTPNRGLPAARNYGIERASGQYICCLDADDKFHQKFLEKSFRVLETDRSGKIGIVTSYYQRFGNSKSKIKVIDFNPFALAVQNQFYCASLFRKSCWEQAGGYNPELSALEDWDFWLSIIALGYRWATLHEILFYYRDRSDSMINQPSVKKSTLLPAIIDRHRDYFHDNAQNILEEYVHHQVVLLNFHTRMLRRHKLFKPLKYLFFPKQPD